VRAAVRMRLLTVRSIEDLIPVTAGTRRAVALRAEGQQLTERLAEARALYADGVLGAASLRLRVADLTKKVRVLDDALEAVERQNALPGFWPTVRSGSPRAPSWKTGSSPSPWTTCGRFS